MSKCRCFYKKENGLRRLQVKLSSNYLKQTLIMKSLYHILVDFGADTSLFGIADFPRNSIIFIFAPLADDYYIRANMAVIVNMVYCNYLLH